MSLAYLVEQRASGPGSMVGPPELVALEVRDGSERWRVQLAATWWGIPPGPFLGVGAIVAPLDDGGLAIAGLDPGSGAVLWRIDVNDRTRGRRHRRSRRGARRRHRGSWPASDGPPMATEQLVAPTFTYSSVATTEQLARRCGAPRSNAHPMTTTPRSAQRLLTTPWCSHRGLAASTPAPADSVGGQRRRRPTCRSEPSPTVSYSPERWTSQPPRSTWPAARSCGRNGARRPPIVDSAPSSTATCGSRPRHPDAARPGGMLDGVFNSEGLSDRDPVNHTLRASRGGRDVRSVGEARDCHLRVAERQSHPLRWERLMSPARAG